MSHSLRVPEAVCDNVSKVRRSEAQHGTWYPRSDPTYVRTPNGLPRSAVRPVVQDIIALYWKREVLGDCEDGRSCCSAASPHRFLGSTRPSPTRSGGLGEPGSDLGREALVADDPSSQNMNVFLCDTGSK